MTERFFLRARTHRGERVFLFLTSTLDQDQFRHRPFAAVGIDKQVAHDLVELGPALRWTLELTVCLESPLIGILHKILGFLRVCGHASGSVVELGHVAYSQSAEIRIRHGPWVFISTHKTKKRRQEFPCSP